VISLRAHVLMRRAPSLLRRAFPEFRARDQIAVRPMDRLPITPQPGGRLTVEYMQTVENRLALLDGDLFAMATR